MKAAVSRTYNELALYEPSIHHGRVALESLRRLRGDDDALTMQAAVQLGTVLTTTARVTEAEPLLRQALAWYERQEVPDPAARANILKWLTFVLIQNNRTREADTTVAKARPLLLATAGENSLPYVDFLNLVGSVKRMEGDFAGAAAAYRESIALGDRIAPNDTRSTPAQINLCTALFILGDDVGLKSALARVTDDSRRGFGEDSAFYQSALLLAAARNFAAGDYSQAVSKAQRFIALMGSRYPDDSLGPVQMRAVLGASLVRTGRAVQGEPLLRKAYEQGRGIDKVNFVQTICNLETALGECLSAQGRYPEAEPLLLTGHADLEKRLGSQNHLTLYSRGLLHALYIAWDHPKEAVLYQ